ncbi:hypothetical protein AOLI_G00209740 [Acnodon oligacanthus]
MSVLIGPAKDGILQLKLLLCRLIETLRFLQSNSSSQSKECGEEEELLKEVLVQAMTEIFTSKCGQVQRGGRERCLPG